MASQHTDAGGWPEEPRHGALMTISVPAIIWAAHFLACYITNAIACAFDMTGREILGAPAIPALITLWTVIALALIGFSALHAARNVRLARRLTADDSAIQRRRLFLPRVTMILSALGTIAVIMTALPTYFVPQCA